MQQSDSMTSFETPPRNQTPSPYIPEQDAARDELMGVLSALRACDATDMTSKLYLGAQLHRLLIESEAPTQACNDFREAAGFLIIVQTFSALGQTVYKNEQDTQEDDHSNERLRVEIFSLFLTILHEALAIPANSNEFDRSIGWVEFGAVLKLTNICETSPTRFFAALLGFCLGDVTTNLAKFSCLTAGEVEDLELERANEIADTWSGYVQHEGILVTLVRFFIKVPSPIAGLQVCVLATLDHLARLNKHNLVTMVDTRLSTVLIDLPVLKRTALYEARRRLLRCLYGLGIPTHDGKTILRNLDADLDNTTLELLQQTVMPSMQPNNITFDMRRYGHCSVAVSSLRRRFPPSKSSPGYMFFTTLYVEQTQSESYIDILHIFDADRKVSVKLMLDCQSEQLVYISSPDSPPVRFAHSRIVPGRWTHVCLTHFQPRGDTTLSRTLLHIDGTLADDKQSMWPKAPLTSSAVRAVLGTPPLENVLKGRRTQNNTVWSLGPAYLLDDVLAPEIPLVIAELALAGYGGNFQDSLGRFLTYSTSTRVNLALDAMARRMENADNIDLSHHPLVHIITESGKQVFGEDRFYFILNAASRWSLDKITRKTAPLVRTSTATVDASHHPSNDLLLNQAVTLTRHAVEASYGYAKLFGDPVLSVPIPLSDTVWQLGGCAGVLWLVEQSKDSQTLEMSLKLFLDLVGVSWRLSEDVEMVRAYEILNFMITEKASLVTLPILETLCGAVGLQLRHPSSWGDAALINPFLYRVMMLDFSLWTQMPLDVQLAHLDHFVALLKSSRYRRFNAKRMAKMQIARKILFAMETLQAQESRDSRTEDKDVVMSKYITTLRIVLISSFNDGAIRALSSFLAAQLCVTSTLGKPHRQPRRQQTMLHSEAVPSSSLSVFQLPNHSQSSDAPNKGIRAVALSVFTMLTELVLERPAFLLKLGSVVNIKWLLVFFGPRSDPQAAKLSLEIMTALLAREPRYAERLIRSGGVKVMERLLPRYWSAPGVFALCWSGLFSRSNAASRQEKGSLYAEYAKSDETIGRPMMLRLILACLSNALHNLAVPSSEHSKRPRPSDQLQVLSASNRKGVHGRKRSHSMNMDAKELIESFQNNWRIDLVNDNVRLIAHHAQESDKFRGTLFAATNLRLLIGAITPFVQDSSSEMPSDSPSVQRMSLQLLDVISHTVVQSLMESGSTAAVNAVIEAIPPYLDLSTVTTFRLMFYDSVARTIKDFILPGLGDVLDEQGSHALADFIEQCSGEVQSSETLDLTAALLETQAARQSPAIITSLFTSLDRIILFRLAENSATIFHDIIRHRNVVFMQQNQDQAFFHCLLYNVLWGVHGEAPTDDDYRLSCYNVLMLLASSRPVLVESIMAEDRSLRDLHSETNVDTIATLLQGHKDQEDIPFLLEWQGFTKSTTNLKAAIHLDRMSRIKLSLDKSDERQKAISTTEARMMTWQNTVRVGEETRIAKMQMDSRETKSYIARQWRARLCADMRRERGLLGPSVSHDRVFELDPTEGPLRMRAKLHEVQDLEARTGEDPLETQVQVQPKHILSDTVPGSHGDEWPSGDGIFGEEVENEEPSVNESSAERTNALPDDMADTHDDKYRRVIRSLEKGDIIEGVENSLRVVFIEYRASLLIFGKKCLYIVDDYFQRPDGELCNLWEAPEEERDTIVMSTLATDVKDTSKRGMSLVQQLEGNVQQTRKWKWSELRLVTLKTFLHRKTAIEVSFHDGQTCLLVLATSDQANAVFQSFTTRNRHAVQAFEYLRDNVRISNGPHSVSQPNNSTNSQGGGLSSRPSGGFSRLAGAVLGRGIGSITQRWIERKITNFDYLMCLNTAAGRTYQDITQYPVMPFILRDYTSEKLDLNDPNTFRDLSLPMGAQNEKRRKQFEERYAQLKELQDIDPDATKPFHYGTHYSTAATVSGFLIRLRPFDKIVKALQGGAFDLPDRTFSSVGHAFTSASEGSLGDVRELIPEAFYLPEFLVNSNVSTMERCSTSFLSFCSALTLVRHNQEQQSMT